MTVDIADWFQPGELDVCPKCAQATLLPPATTGGVSICVACGIISEAASTAAASPAATGETPPR